MDTRILRVDPKQIDTDLISEAAKVIKFGGLVAFPTETVYGLGADALNPGAVAKVFAVKGRPSCDPLIVHIADKGDLSKFSAKAGKIAFDLADMFWPGPLTLILEKPQVIPPIVTSGLKTVAVRMPDHPVALSLIRESQTPIAAPSANLFGRPSPATAQHVLDDLNGKVDLILDAGKASVGVESTILDLTQDPFCILRPGGISLESLKKVIPDIKPYRGIEILSPGMFKRHYSPKAKVILIEDNGIAQTERVKEVALEFIMQGYSVGVMTKEENRSRYNGDFNIKVLGPGENLNLCAANLFTLLRDFDNDGAQVIIAEGVKEEGLGAAIMDRLRKAAAKEDYV